MKKLMVLLCAVFLVFSMIGVAGAAMVWDGGFGNGIWKDVNKSGAAQESVYCWAGAAANTLAWTGWTGWDSTTNTEIASNTDIYAQFVNDWSAGTGNVLYAHQWWFMGNVINPNYGPPANYAAGTGGYYSQAILYPPAPALGTEGWWDGAAEDHETAISGYVADHRGIVIDMYGSSDAGLEYGHQLTVWGIDTALGELYVTDTDDGVIDLQTYNYSLHGDGFWYIDDYSNTYTTNQAFLIRETHRLNINTAGVLPNGYCTPGVNCPGDQVDPPCDTPGGPPCDDGNANHAVPEPATILLLGSGLFGLAIFRRKRNA